MTQSFEDPTHKRLSDNSDDDSVDSEGFQVLNTVENESTNEHFTFYDRNQGSEKINQQQGKENTISTVAQLKQASEKLLVQGKELQLLRVESQNYKTLYENSQRECSIWKEKFNNHVTQNSNLKEINLELKQLVSSIKEENEEYIDKINCLQKKFQLERQEIDNKFNNIKRNVQLLTKVPIKNIDNDGFIKLLGIKFGQVEKLLNKIVEIDDMIIDKNQKNKPVGNPQQVDVLQEKLQVMDKIQGLLVKQQNRVNSLKQQNLRLDDLLQQSKKSNGSISSGFGKLLDPVIKFCKIEESREVASKETEIKKKKDNVNI